MKTIKGAAGALVLALTGTLGGCGQPTPDPVQRGAYLVQITGCSDCHTPGGLGPKADTSRLFGGSDVDFVVPGMGVFVPPNLTPDKATGLGTWTTEQIVSSLQVTRHENSRHNRQHPFFGFRQLG